MVSTISAEKQTSPAAVVPVNGLNAPMTPTPRRKPQCKKCGRPMLGHKRGQCDGDATPTKVKVEDLGELEDDLTAQLAGLRIEKPNFGAGDSDSDGEKKTKRRDSRRRSSVPRRPARRLETVDSLNSEDKALVDSLARPGLMSNNVVINESAARANIEGWLETVKPNEGSESPKRSRQKRLSGRPSISPKHDFDAMLDLPPKEKTTTSRRSLAKSAKPLGRTSSDAEREQFFSQLAVKSKGPVARVYTVEGSDIQALEENAKRLNFHVRVIAPKNADGRPGNGWLVVGSDQESVEELFEDVKEEVESGKALADVKEDVKGGKSYVGALGGIAIGTAVTWIYLAFS